MRPYPRHPFNTSLVILLTPAALLGVLALTFARNSLARPVIRAGNSPDGAREAVIILEYPPAYPFSGEVRAFLEVRRLPGHERLLQRTLGWHRWSSQALDAYRTVDWSEPTRLTLRSADGLHSSSIFLDPGLWKEGMEPPSFPPPRSR